MVKINRMKWSGIVTALRGVQKILRRKIVILNNRTKESIGKFQYFAVGVSHTHP